MIEKPPEWVDDARCAVGDTDPDWWWIAEGETVRYLPAENRMALHLCRTACPVRAQCHQWALEQADDGKPWQQAVIGGVVYDSHCQPVGEPKLAKPAKPTEPTELNLNEAADYTKRYRAVLSRAIKQGELRARRDGHGQWRITTAELDRWVAYVAVRRERFGDVRAVAREAIAA